MKLKHVMRLLQAAEYLLDKTGELDKDGTFVPCPQASLSRDTRDESTPWHFVEWTELSVQVAKTKARVAAAALRRLQSGDSPP